MRSLIGTALFVFLVLGGQALYGQSSSGSYLQIFVDQYAPGDDPSVPSSVRRALTGPLQRRCRDHYGTTWQATSAGLLETGPDGRKLWTGRDGLPWLTLDGIAAGVVGARPSWPPSHKGASDRKSKAGRMPALPGLWLATHHGAILFIPSASAGQRWYLFAGRRYLADDDVLGLEPDASSAWIRTRTGVSRIEFRAYTLAQKAAYFEDRVAQRHMRDGFVNDCVMASPGDLARCRPEPSDNDGLWTAIYAAAECFRYAVTGSTEALSRARISLDAMLRLETVTATPGFPARAIAAPGEDRDPGGEWHDAGDGRYWKGDTSSDELVGHFFADWVAYNLLPAGPAPGGSSGDDLRNRAASEAARIAQRLIDHGLRLVGPDGRMTRWGNYTPQYFKTSEGAEDAGLDSLEILSHLCVAGRISGRQGIEPEYHRVAFDLGYVANVSQLASPPAEINYSDEELAYLAFAPLVDPLPRAQPDSRTPSPGAEDDPAIAARYRTAVERFWARTRDENNPLWTAIAAAALPAEADFATAREALERIPMDTVNWTVKNSGRADIVLRPRKNRFGRPQSTRALPPNERPVMKWNGDPFELYGGDGGRTEDDGAFFLLPYWMARYYGVVG